MFNLLKNLSIATLIITSPIALATGTTSLDNGKSVYQRACAVCHTNGVAGAPKVHDQAAWKKRLSLAESNGKQLTPPQPALQVLVMHVNNGLGAMPPKGMCPKCTDGDIEDAIHFMMSK